MTQAKTATIKDLTRVDGKAELVDGEIVTLPPHGFLPDQAKGAILWSLHEYAKLERKGYASGGTVAYVVDLPHRKSFCPDVAYYVGGPLGMGFPEGAPRFAVEIRGENDRGSSAENGFSRNVPITSRLARWSCGTWISSAPTWCAPTDPVNPTSPRSSAVPITPKLNLPCRDGASGG